MKILTILGTRPQFVKAAAVSRAFAKHPSIEEIIVHTGQHYDDPMSAVFFKEMEIPAPQYNLDVNKLGHGAMTGQMMEGIEKILVEARPDYVLVFGDSNTTLAGALAGKKMHYPVIHVEAGLRSFNMKMPEEINRVLTDRISDMLFCPTAIAVANLRQEGMDKFPVDIIQNGDVMYDAALHYANFSAERSGIMDKIGRDEFILCTMHRQENTDDAKRLQSIVSTINEIDRQIRVVLPLHPRTKKMLEHHGLALTVTAIDPVGYFDMIELLKHCRLVMTDSGGLQKEAFLFKKFCVTLRDETEWVELVDHGFNRLAGADSQAIRAAYQDFLNREADFNVGLFGNGDASDIIAAKLLEKGGR